MNDSRYKYNYDHLVAVYLVNGKQILFVPVLGCIGLSNSALIYDYPVPIEFLGEQILLLFEQMDMCNLEFKADAKDYWLMPKGIRGWKKFEASALSILIRCAEDNLIIHRHRPSPPRGYSAETEEPNFISKRSIPAVELGKIIISQFEYMVANPYIH